MGVLLVVVVALPLVGGVADRARDRIGSTVRRGALPGVLTAAAAFVGALVLGGAQLGGGAVVVGWSGSDGRLWAGWATDRVALLLLLLVLAVSTVVQLFARRYLEGDPRAGWFSAWAGLLTTASAGLVTSATLLTLAVCWTAAGVALCGLLATYPDVPAARVGLVRTAATFLVGDLVLWLAVGAVSITWGTLDLRGLGPGATAGHPVVLGLVACAVVVAALTRSAQVPAHRWLPATLAAPTPVSALLHAGVVNAGGILLVKLGGLIGAVPAAGGLAFTAGAATVLWGTVLMLAKPDVKGVARALDDGADGIHDHDLRVGPVRPGGVPPRRPRALQGDVVPRLGHCGAPPPCAQRRGAGARRRPPSAPRRDGGAGDCSHPGLQRWRWGSS